MQDALEDIVKIGMSSAAGWTFFWASRGDKRGMLVCAACGYQGDPVEQRWSRLACATCGEKLLVPPDSPMAAGYWQSRPRRQPVLASHARPAIERERY